MKEVELIRQRVTRAAANEVIRLRVFVSGISGNEATVERLRGDAGNNLVAKLVEFWMRELGHVNEVGSEERGSLARRAVATQRRVT